MNNQLKLKSSLTRAETLEGLDDVTEMSDGEIAKNAEAIRHLATSAHMHITRIGAHRDKLKRQLKARPKADTPTNKPLELVRIKSKPEYGTFVVESLRAQIIPTATNTIVHRKVIVDIDDLEVVE